MLFCGARCATWSEGFYVDVGAADPEVDSVTHAFYERGWSGINIEPLDEYFVKLTQAQTARHQLEAARRTGSGAADRACFPWNGSIHSGCGNRAATNRADGYAGSEIRSARC